MIGGQGVGERTMSSTASFRTARDFLLAHRTDHAAACRGFAWPQLDQFNWALDWFDADLARDAESKDRLALWIVDVASGRESKATFGELSRRSNQVANWMKQRGLKRGDHLLLVLNNVMPLWEIMLAAMKIGVVVIPATTLLTAEELADRVERGRARMIVTDQDQVAKCKGLPRTGVIFVTISDKPDEGWLSLSDAYKCSAEFTPNGVTRAEDFRWHAVRATEVAAIRHRDAQVAQRAPPRVERRGGRSRCGRGHGRESVTGRVILPVSPCARRRVVLAGERAVADPPRSRAHTALACVPAPQRGLCAGVGARPRVAHGFAGGSRFAAV